MEISMDVGSNPTLSAKLPLKSLNNFIENHPEGFSQTLAGAITVALRQTAGRKIFSPLPA